MGDKDLKYPEISEEFMNSLRDAYKVQKETAAEECPMSEMAISYAAQELDSKEHQQFRDHLHTCKFCLDLVLDVQALQAESKATDDQPSKVLPALSKAIRKPRSSSQSDSHLNGIKELFSKFFFPLLSPKFIGVVATACLAFIIFNYGLKDPEVTQKLNNINKRIVPQENAKKQPHETKTEVTEQIGEDKKRLIPPKKKMVPSPPKSDLTPNKTNTYDPVGKIDPFEDPYKNGPALAKKTKRKKRLPQTPLERLDLSQLKLVGIMLSESGNKALMEDSTGQGYIVSKGTYIGRNSGKVYQIKKDRIVIEEEFEDVDGKITIKKRELILQNDNM